MNRLAGIWIDHKKAVIVSIVEGKEKFLSVISDMEKHIRFSGGAEKESEEDQRDRRFTNHLNKYYDETVLLVKDAESILIIGPGEAKVEFKKRLEANYLKGRVIDLETADKMTDGQIKAKVKDHFLSNKL